MPEDKDIIEEMLENYRLSEESDHATRALSLDDLKFVAAFDENGDSTHWSPKDLKQRGNDGVPTVTLDHISQFPKQITNEFRLMKMGIQAVPVGGGADPATAETIGGIIRATEQNSHASVAWETAVDFAVNCGFGFVRIRIERTHGNPRTGQEFSAQHIEIKRVKNPFTIFGDPTGEEPDGSDWEYCVIAETMLDKVYRRKYKDSELAGLSDWGGISRDLPAGWLSGKSTTVAEYFYSKHKQEKALLFSDGIVRLKSLLDANFEKHGSAGLPEGVIEVDDRLIDTRTIHWIKSNGREVLDRSDWLGIYIPIIPVYGSEFNLDGKIIRYGMIRNAKDAQRGIDFMFSAAITAVGRMPKAPYMVAAGQIDKYKDIWADANRKEYVALPYDPVDINGKLAPPPQRQAFEPAIAGMMGMITHLQFTMKAAQGMYGSSLGEPSGEKSGVAIESRKAQGDKSTFHFLSNAERSMWHVGRIMVDLIPKVIDNKTALQILGKDGKKSSVIVDNDIPEEQRAAAAQEETPRFNIKAGRYDVAIIIGQAYATQRQESVVKLSEILKTWGPAMPPQAMQVMLIELLKNIDMPGGREMAEKIEEIFGSLKEGQPIPPEVQQQMQAMGQQLQALAGELQEAKNRELAKKAELDSKERTERLRLESQENIAATNAEVDVFRVRAHAAEKLADLGSREALAQLDADAATAKANIERLREENQPKEPVAVP